MGAQKLISAFFGKMLRGRFAVLFSIVWLYIYCFLFFVRIVLLFWSISDLDFDVVSLARALFIGIVFDVAVGLCFVFVYTIYLWLLPSRWIGKLMDKAFTYFYISIILFIIFFSLMAEFPFWDEFGVRFNFIAVDYLVYTYEVVSNINQSYPIPIILLILLIILTGTITILHKRGIFNSTFTAKFPFRKRSSYAIPLIIITVLLLTFLKNKQTDFSSNTLINEIGKNGVYSFFAAFHSNELDYETFYPQIDKKEAYAILKKDIYRKIRTLQIKVGTTSIDIQQALVKSVLILF